MKKITLLSLIFLTFFACRDNIDETISTEVTQSDPNTILINYEEEVREVTATVFGLVADEAGNPISNAAVKLKNNTTTTDDDGRFVFKETTMNGAGTFVIVSKNGYFDGSDRFFPKEGSVNYSSIIMLERSNTGSFVSTDGGLIESSEGISLDFPANSVVNANGTTYEGTVEVSARFINPTANNLAEVMPGGLQGVDQNAEEVALASYGMMAVELESTNGEPLNLGNDLKATLSFPVPAELLADAPAEIPLWYFDNDYGIWVQEGSATLQGDKYVGEVAHFSFWNCDAPFPLIELTGRLVSTDGTPLANTWVQLTMSNGTSGYGLTDNDGYFGGKVPKDEVLGVTVYQYYNCDDIYTGNIGPFADDTDIGDITVDLIGLLEITGTVLDCDDNPLTNGWVDITVGTRSFSYYVLDGTIDIAITNCENDTELTILAKNLTDLEEGDLLTYTIVDPLDLGDISACGNALSEYFIIELDGVTTTFVDVSISINGPDSTWLSAFNDINLTDSNVNLGMDDIPTVGTYDDDLVNYANMFLPGSAGNFYSMQCGGGSCGFTEINITTLGNVGEEVIGTFSGESEFFDNNGTVVTLPYSGSFKTIRD